MKIYRSENLKDIVQLIIDNNYSLNYASVIGAYFVFEENPEVHFTNDFSRYALLMKYFLNAMTEENDPNNFRRIIDDLNLALTGNDVIEKEHLIYIIYKPEIKKLEGLYKNRKITFETFKQQLMKLGDGNFDYDLMIAHYIGQ